MILLDGVWDIANIVNYGGPLLRQINWAPENPFGNLPW